jgi:hypothetical protein
LFLFQAADKALCSIGVVVLLLAHFVVRASTIHVVIDMEYGMAET